MGMPAIPPGPDYVAQQMAGAALAALTISPMTQPATPFNVLALAGNARASVQWKVRNQGATSYTVTASPGGQSVTVAASGLNGSATVTGLSNGTPYSFMVTANNAAGSSTSILSSNSVTPTALPSSVLPVTRALEFWWSASQVTGMTNGASLTLMSDISGNGYDAVAGINSSTPQPATWVSSWSGGKPAIQFDGHFARYETSGSGLYQGMRGPNATIYLVYAVAANPNTFSKVSGRVLSSENNQLILKNGFAIGVGATGGQSNPELINLSTGSSATITEGPTQATLGTPVYISAVRPGPFRVNGAPVSGALAEPAIALPGNPWAFGSPNGGAFNNSAQIYLAEVVLFADVHTPTEIGLMETYLAGRY